MIQDIVGTASSTAVRLAKSADDTPADADRKGLQTGITVRQGVADIEREIVMHVDIMLT